VEDIKINKGDLMEEEKLQKGIEVEGGTVEEAIQKALDILKVSREDVHVRVVCEEKKGLFGMEGAKPAKIKVSIKMEEEESPES
jgi:spoIIIJ-associated protein